MRIWPRRLVKRAVFFAVGSCIVPILIASLVGARNGTAGIAFAALKQIAGGGEPRSRCVSWGAGCMRPGGRVDLGNDSWAEARTGPSDPGSIANRLTHGEALAPMVAG